MTSRFVVDASAWIEYFKGSAKGKKISEIIENSNEIFCSSATVAEVISKTLREGNDFNIALTHINNWSTIVNLNSETSILAGQIHFEEKKKNKDFGMLDAFVVAAAKKLNAKILTGDNDFKHFKEAVIF